MGRPKGRGQETAAQREAADKDGAIVITVDYDRTEGWTPVGKRMVVEHWCPSSQYPCGKATLGIADRER